MTTAGQSAHTLMVILGLKVTTNQHKQSLFIRSSLPSPESFWASHGIQLKVKKGWVMAKCTFHDDRHASLGINAESGGFFCHACGVKGGDVLAAYRLFTGCDFVAAAQALGAWEEK